MSPPPEPRYTFGPFEMDPAERRLTREGEPVAVLPKVFDVLLILVGRAGHLVTKQEIMNEVWPDVEVQESSLTATMSRLRVLLEDQGRHGAYLETVTGHGYRFVAPVKVLPVTAVERGGRPLIASSRRRRPLVLVLVAMAGLALASSLVAGPRRDGDSETRALAEAAYRRGLAFLATRRQNDVALDAFRESARLDPEFAPAHAGIAQVYAMDFSAAALVQDAAKRAIALDPRSADAWAALGFSRAMHEWDWAGAEEAFQRALAVDPDDAGTLQWLATVLMIQRRFDEADRLLTHALRREVRAGLYADRCQLEYYREAYLAARAECARATQLDPVFPFVSHWKLRIALHRRDGAGAAAALGLSRGSDMPAVLDSLMEMSSRAPGPQAWMNAAEWHALAGERDAALDALDSAVAARAFWAPFANADPTFDIVRHDPRFRRAMARMGLGEAAGAATGG